MYSSSDFEELMIGETPPSDNCVIAKHESEFGDPDLSVEYCQSMQSDKIRGGICQYTACTSKDGNECIFPFR